MSDHHPFHTMLPPHRSALHRYARKLTHQEDRAEDLVQQTFLKAWVHRDKFMIGTNLRPWLFTILRNTFYSDLRKSRWEDQDVEGRLAATLSEEAPQEHAMHLKEVMAAVAALPDAQRRPLVLMSAYGYSQREAATACKCSVGTIKSRVSRARIALSQKIEINPRNFRLHDRTDKLPPIVVDDVTAPPWHFDAVGGRSHHQRHGDPNLHQLAKCRFVRRRSGDQVASGINLGRLPAGRPTEEANTCH